MVTVYSKHLQKTPVHVLTDIHRSRALGEVKSLYKTSNQVKNNKAGSEKNVRGQSRRMHSPDAQLAVLRKV